MRAFVPDDRIVDFWGSSTIIKFLFKRPFEKRQTFCDYFSGRETEVYFISLQVLSLAIPIDFGL